MKHKITLSIALALSVVLVSLMSSDSTAKAQQPQRYRADTGLVKLGPGQILRITASPAGGNYTFVFRQTGYMQTSCNGGVCKLAVESQSTTNPIPLLSGEAAFYDIGGGDTGTHEVRGVVLTNSQNVKVNAAVIDGAQQDTGTLFQVLVTNENLNDF